MFCINKFEISLKSASLSGKITDDLPNQAIIFKNVTDSEPFRSVSFSIGALFEL